MDRVAPEERLLNLIIALTHTRTRMTRAEIRASVEGYEPPAQSATSEAQARADAAFERMFERDKEDLRRMGVPLLTITDSAHGDDIGYRISASDAAMEPLDLTPAELSVVSIAVDYWRGAALGTDARQAVTKVASRVPHGTPVELPFAARATASRDALGALIDAIHERRAVTFEYSSTTSGTSVRTVEPWRVVLRGGNEYLIGHDLGREAPRTFRVGRILGAVRMAPHAGSFEIPRDVPLGELAPGAVVGTARVAVRPEVGHSLRRRGAAVGTEGAWDLLDVPYRHLDALGAEILSLAGGARAVWPPELVTTVIDRARAALEVGRG